MDAGGAGLQPNAVTAALLHDLRLLQLQLVDSRHHNAIAGLPHIPEGGCHLVVLRFHRRQLGKQAHQVPVIGHLKAGLLRQRLVEQLPGQGQTGCGHAGAQIDGGDLRLADVFALSQGGDDALHLPDMAELCSVLADGVVQSRFDGVTGRQSVHPRRQEQVQLLHWELVEHRLQYGGHRVLVQLQAIDSHAVDLVPGGDVLGDGLGPVAPGVGGVQQNDEGLSQLLQLPDHPLLRLQVVLPGDVGDGAVGGDDDADGGVLSDDLPGADLRRLGHGDLVVVPGGSDHPGGVVLHLADGSLHHVAHAVDKPHGAVSPVRQLDLGGLLRDELGLGGHDGPAGAALGQLIPGPLLPVHVIDVGDHLGLHEPFDERGLPGAHGAHHTDINIPSGAGGDILIDTGIHSIPSFFRSIVLFHSMSGCCEV